MDFISVINTTSEQLSQTPKKKHLTVARNLNDTSSQEGIILSA